MTAPRAHAAIAIAGVALAMAWPLSPALSSREMVQVRLVAAALTAAACAMIAVARGVRPRAWTAIAAVASAIAVAALLWYSRASSTCIARYADRLVVIGREYTPAAAGYAQSNPSAEDILLDAGGAVDRIWTRESIASCRFAISWAGLLVVPLVAIGVSAIVARRGSSLLPISAVTRPARSDAPVPAARYDAFISYRHGEPDATYARHIVEMLDAHHLRAAIDDRDFGPNQAVVSEMERCVRQSRFVLCIVTSRYVASEYCAEEAIVSKTFDLSTRAKRLVPLVFERVDLPLWLHGLVGIDFTGAASTDPATRLLALLTAPPDAST